MRRLLAVLVVLFAVLLALETVLGFHPQPMEPLTLDVPAPTQVDTLKGPWFPYYGWEWTREGP